jgi:uncharacterized membrane protein
MNNRRFQFSLRTLLIATTIFAVLTAVEASFPRVIMGLAMWLMGIGFFITCYFAPFKEDLEGPKTTEQVRHERRAQNLE